MNRTSPPSVVAALSLSVVLLVFIGCEAAEPVEEPIPVVQATVRDSAGVEIVENTEGAWTPDRAWTIASEPDLRIGVVDGDPAYMLERVTGAVTLSDGRIVVGDGGANLLRVYDASGQWVEDAGGPGEGPGEFDSIRLLRRFSGDSIFVFDWSNQRYTVLSPSWEVGRVVSLDVSMPGITLPHIKAVTASGAPILIGARPPWVDDPDPFYGQPGHFFVEASPGSGSFEQEMKTFTGQGNFWKTLYATSGELLVVISTGHFAVDLYDLQGRKIRSIRREMEPKPIPESFFDADPDEAVGTLVGPQGRIMMTRGTRDPENYPENLPYTDDLLVDRAGNFWLRHYRYKDPILPFDNEGLIPDPEGTEEAPPVYSIFDSGGQLLGEVELPSGAELLEVGDDWLLCLVKDDLDVEYVERYRIEKPASD